MTIVSRMYSVLNFVTDIGRFTLNFLSVACTFFFNSHPDTCRCTRSAPCNLTHLFFTGYHIDRVVIPREAPDTNLGLQTDYRLSWFFTVPPVKYYDSTHQITASFHIPPSSLFINHSTPYRLRYVHCH